MLKNSEIDRMQYAVNYCIGYLDQALKLDLSLDAKSIKTLLDALKESKKEEDNYD